MIGELLAYALLWGLGVALMLFSLALLNPPVATSEKCAEDGCGQDGNNFLNGKLWCWHHCEEEMDRMWKAHAEKYQADQRMVRRGWPAGRRESDIERDLRG